MDRSPSDFIDARDGENATGTTCSRAARAIGSATTTKFVDAVRETAARADREQRRAAARRQHRPSARAVPRALALPPCATRASERRRARRRQARRRARGPETATQATKGDGGNDEGGYQFVLELQDRRHRRLALGGAQASEPQGQERRTAPGQDFTREGWSRHGVRSRLDRRRSLKEAIKRRAIHEDAPAFTDDDLRYRQLVMRQRPATEAVVFFAMDVSSSMTERDRRLAKTFFFWVVQGLRRQYTHIEPVFVAHTIEAWEFSEDEFFQVTRLGRHRRIVGVREDPRDRRAALRSGSLQHLFLLRLRRRELPARPTTRAQARCRAWRRS